MPTFLLHLTSGGTPVGVYTESGDFYDSQFEQLREEGRELVYSKLPNVPWSDFIERLASTTPSRTMRWDTYFDQSTNLSVVLRNARRDVVTTGKEEPE